jgi:hypothetical protein
MELGLGVPVPSSRVAAREWGRQWHTPSRMRVLTWPSWLEAKQLLTRPQRSFAAEVRRACSVCRWT